MRRLDWPRWLETTILLNDPLLHWLFAAGIALAVFLGLLAVKAVVIRRIGRLAERTETDLDDFLVDLVRRTRALVVGLVAIELGSLYLRLPGRLGVALKGLTILAILVQVGIWLSVAIDWWVARTRRQRLEKDAASATLIGALRFVAKLILWSLLLLVALDNFGVDVTALVAGLGVGGIAIALAVQNVLGDLLGSLSIVLDKPFVVGDAISVGEFSGKVEGIGLKTTRVRSVSGEQVIFPNGDLLQSRIRNWARLAERRVALTFGVVYQTPPEVVAAIPGIVRGIVSGQSEVRFERSHFRGLGTSSLDFETIYWITSPDYNLFMDRQQAINLELLRAFEREGIAFADSTRTVLLPPDPPPEKEEKEEEDGRALLQP